MFENVDQLEREVREFQENILASKELVRNLEQLVVAAKAQQEQLAKSTDDLLRGIPTSVEGKNSALRAEIQQTAVRMQADSNAAVNKAISEVQRAHQQHIEQLTSVETQMKKVETDLIVKYTDFVAKLEASNMDKIFTMCEDIKKTVNSKFTILLAGVGLSVVLAVVALFVK